MSRIVSVIIPAYNVDKYISKCLNSVLEQSYQDIQIIVVDDGSTDRTLEIIKEYSSKDSRIIAIHKDNGGVSSARNKALEYATGEYITFLDADDALESDAIAILIKTIENSSADWVFAGYSRRDETGNRLTDYVFETGEFSFGTDLDRTRFIIEKILPYRVGVEVWSKLFKSEIIRNNGLLFSEKCHIGEDYSFTIKYLMHISKIICISDRLYNYCIRENSAMGGLGELDKALSERTYMLLDLWQHFDRIDNVYIKSRFPLLFMLLLDKVCTGHSAYEVADKLKKIELLDFAKDNYRKLPGLRQEYYSLFSSDIIWVKYNYHMYIRASLLGFSFYDRIKFGIYNLYRSFKGTERIERWKQPY